MNRELFLSLGITILTGATLFIYFRHRFKTMEHKVNTIFQMVQNHAKSQQMPLPPMSQMMHPMMHHGAPMPPSSTQPPTQDPLIEVSDDDESTDDDSSCDENDTGSERSDDDTNTPNEIEIQNIKVEDGLKQISVTLGSSSETSINLEEKTDLDDISSLEDNEVNKEEEEAHVIEETPDYAKMTVATLKKIASKKGITGYNKLRKQGLVDILSN